MPELPDSLKDAMAALLVTAATLERSYQEVLDADKSPEWRLQVNELNKLYRTWVADLEHFASVLKRSAVPKKAVDIFVDAFDVNRLTSFHRKKVWQRRLLRSLAIVG